MRAEKMRVGGICVFHYKDSKSVSPRRSSVQLRVYFKFSPTSDNPTVSTTDSVELMSDNVCPLSLSLQFSVSLLVSLSLSVMTHMCLRTHKHRKIHDSMISGYTVSQPQHMPPPP